MSFDFHLSHWGCVPGLVGNMPAETTVRRSSRDMARSCWRPARSMQHHAAWKTRKILRHLKSVKEMEQRHPILSWIYNNTSKKYVGQCGPWDSLVWGILKIIIPSWIPREKPSPPHVFELRFFVWAVWQHEGLNPCHGLHETELSSSTVFHWHWMAYNPKGMFELQRPSSSYRHLWYFLIHLSNNISVLMFIWVHHFGCSGTVPLSSNIGQLVVRAVPARQEGLWDKQSHCKEGQEGRRLSCKEGQETLWMLPIACEESKHWQFIHPMVFAAQLRESNQSSGCMFSSSSACRNEWACITSWRGARKLHWLFIAL